MAKYILKFEVIIKLVYKKSIIKNWIVKYKVKAYQKEMLSKKFYYPSEFLSNHYSSDIFMEIFIEK